MPMMDMSPRSPVRGALAFVRKFSLLLGFLAGSASAAAAAECGPLKLATSLDLMTLGSGRPAVSATIAGHPLTLLVDSGAIYSQLSARTVRRLGLPTTVARDRRIITDITGKTSVDQVRLPDIAIGALHQEGAYFFVSPEHDDDEERPFANEYDGIVGADLLQNFDADFDFAAGKLNLFSPDHCPGKTVYWSAKILATIPFTLDNSLHVRFRAALDGKPLDAIIDTGAINTDLNLDVAHRLLGVDPAADDVEKVSELEGSPVYRRQFEKLEIGGVTIDNPMLLLLPDLVAKAGHRTRPGSFMTARNGLVDMLVGMNVLRRLHVYIAYKERKLYITEAAEEAVLAH
jgi:predicted aspartyl protease